MNTTNVFNSFLREKAGVRLKEVQDRIIPVFTKNLSVIPWLYFMGDSTHIFLGNTILESNILVFAAFDYSIPLFIMQTVTLRSFENYFSANIILSRLQAEGVTCFLKDEHTSTMMPYLGNAIGGIKLDVDIVDAEKASMLLKSFDEEFLRSAQCPKCMGHNILFVPKRDTGNFITAIFTWLFSNYAVSANNVYQCQQCGYESKTLPENITDNN